MLRDDYKKTNKSDENQQCFKIVLYVTIMTAKPFPNTRFGKLSL